MGLNDTPSGERVHIGFFGVRNAGKSSLVNAVCAQEVSLVSDVAGTTTDAIGKAMELLPAGPVLIIDTPGIDDEGSLGALRVEKARASLRKCDMAVLVVDATRGLREADRALLDDFKKRNIPFVVAFNKADLLDGAQDLGEGAWPHALVSALSGEGVRELKELMGALALTSKERRMLVGDLLDAGDAVVLVMPLDASAPKGRIILPQQMVMRDILDAHAVALACQPEELPGLLGALEGKVKLVITDSQAFAQVAQVVSEEVALTSFSILMARYKGSLAASVRAAALLSQLEEGDRVLIAEGCTHHRQCDDIGTVKMPAWIEGHCGAKPCFEFSSGGSFPEDLSPYKLVVHCGGCMLNEREMGFRISRTDEAGVPMLNYGMAIAEMNGLLERSLQVIPGVCA